METVLRFFTETLDGTVYIVAVILSVIFIFALIGFLAERKIKKKKEDARIAVLDREDNKPLSQDDITRQNTAMNVNESGRLSFGNEGNSLNSGNVNGTVSPLNSTLPNGSGMAPMSVNTSTFSNVQTMQDAAQANESVVPVSTVQEVTPVQNVAAFNLNSPINFTPNGVSDIKSVDVPVQEAKLVDAVVSPVSENVNSVGLASGSEPVKFVDPSSQTVQPNNEAK